MRPVETKRLAAFILLLVWIMSKKDIVGRSWKYLLKRDRDHLRWTTIIIGVIRVRESDARNPDRVKEISDQAAEMIAGFRRSWLGITRGRHLAGLVWRGVFELELKREVAPEGHHHATLESMGCDMEPLADDERYLIVHTHFVVAFPDELDGENFADELRSVVQSIWTGKWQTQVKGLHAKKTVAESITNLYSYSYKRRLQYSTGGLGDVPVKFGDGYGWLWSRFVLKVYDSFVFEFRSKK
ncbi:hypothetical protein [Methylorubrum thiocyanatum]|uniref:hypothetical protein n=1 Tax=Methylorubrum thiocyanatum TaxID=47958 RepID=UPI0035C83FD9